MGDVTVKRGALCAALLLCLLLGGLSLQADEGGNGKGVHRLAKPDMVLVADFALDAEAQAKGSDKGLHGPLQVRKRVRGMVDQAQESPDEKAKKIVDTLSESIVAGLTDKGVKAARIGSGREPSSGSWLLEGEFVEYGEGDRLKKAVIGFGSGSSSMGVEVRLSEVRGGGMRPLYDSSMGGPKNRMPGAAVTRNPYVAGAKYVLSKNAPDRDVKKLGAEIAGKLLEYMKSQGL